MPGMELDNNQAVKTDNTGSLGQPVPTDDPARAEARQKLREHNLAGSKESKQGDASTQGKDVKQENTKPEPVKQENGEPKANPKVGLPRGVQRRIDKHHREVQTLKQQLAELSARTQAPKPEDKKKLGRENFVTEDEYIEYLAERKYEERSQKERSEIEAQQRQMESEQAFEQQARNRIARKKQEDFRDDPEALAEFERIVVSVPDEDVPEDMHDLAMSLPYGLRAFSMLLKPEHSNVLEWFGTLPPSIRAIEFDKFTSAVREKLSAPKELKPQITNAPAPIGQVGVGGSAKPNGMMSDHERLRAREQERKRIGY